jgi:hypothetical protein
VVEEATVRTAPPAPATPESSGSTPIEPVYYTPAPQPEAPYTAVPKAPGVFRPQPASTGVYVAPQRTADIGPEAADDGEGGWAAPPRPGPYADADTEDVPPPEQHWAGPPGQRPRRRHRVGALVLSLVLMSVLVAVAAVAVGVMTSRRSERPANPTAASRPPVVAVTSAPAPAPTPSTAPTTAAAPSPSPQLLAPSRIEINDDGLSITLTWRDPTAGTVPFIVGGGQRGRDPSPMQSVPAGRTKSILHGLNPDVDYCFTIAAVYSADVVMTSKRVCTSRLSTGSVP